MRFLFFIAHCSHLTRSLPTAPFPSVTFLPNLPDSTLHPHQAPSAWTNAILGKVVSTPGPLCVDKCHSGVCRVHTRPPMRGRMLFWGMLCPQKAPSAWTNAILGYVVSTPGPLCVDKCYSGVCRVHTRPLLRGRMPFWGMSCPQKAPSAWTNAILGKVVSTKSPLCVDKCNSGVCRVHKKPSLRGQMPFWGMSCPHQAPSAWTNAILGNVVSTPGPFCVDECHSGVCCVHKKPLLRGQMLFWGMLCPQNALLRGRMPF